MVNKDIELKQFKKIYLVELFHRWFGLALGLSFGGGILFWGRKKMFGPKMIKEVAALFGLGAAQGLIGWWMVKSGL